MPEEPADTEAALLKQIAIAYGGATATTVGDTEVPCLKQIASILGTATQDLGDTEVPLLKQIASYYGVATQDLGDTEVPLLKQIVLAQPGTTITNQDLGDTEVPLLVQWLNTAGGSIFDDVAFWRANSGVTGNPVTAWASGLNTLSAAGSARPSVGTDFTPAASIVFNGVANVMSESPSPLSSSVGTCAFVVRTGTIGSEETIFAVSGDAVAGFIHLHINASGKIQFQFTPNGLKTYTVTGNSTLASSTEYQIMVTYDGAAYQVYIDGVAETLTPISVLGGTPGWFSDVPSPRTIYAGAAFQFGAGLQHFFSGALGVIWAWDTVLSSAQRTQVFDYLATNWLSSAAVGRWLWETGVYLNWETGVQMATE